MGALTVAVWIGCIGGAALLAIPVSVILLQVLLAGRVPGPAPLLAVARPRIAVLVPAHNEAAGIQRTLASILRQLAPADRLLVVADNCCDDTAAVAAHCGAEVWPRNEPRLRGKGYALDHGVRRLAADPPDVVIVVDADCEVGVGAIDRLARLAHARNRPVQALYLMHARAGCGITQRIAEFAWIVRNLVRPLGFHRLGLPCQLMGAGMALPWAAICDANLASGHLVEDMKLGLELARAGTPPLFCPHALVSSRFPIAGAAASEQKKRWEHGHLGTILHEAPALLLAGIRRRDVALLALALDLSVPPVALLMLLVSAVFAISLPLSLHTLRWLPLIGASLPLAGLALAVALAWWRFGRQSLGLMQLTMGLCYMLRKVPVYLKFLFNRQVDWVRSKRDGE